MEAQPENIRIQIEDQQQQQLINPAQKVYVDTQETTTFKNLNRHTVLYDHTLKERLIYMFDYSAEVIQTDAQNPIALNKESLMYLKANKKWTIIKHPYVLNYINEILLNSANLYIFHVLTFSAYLIFLYLYISTKNFIFGVIALIAGTYMGFMACAKINFRSEISSKSSMFESCFCFSFSVFILLSYFIASLWILTSLLLSYDIYLSKQMDDFLRGVQIFIIAATWIQCLYVLKYSFFGLYILMLTKILNSLVKMSLAVDDVSELRKDAEEKLLHIKIDYCIQILTLYEFCCFCYSFDKKQIREIMIHSKKDKYLFSKKIAWDTSYDVSQTAPKPEYHVSISPILTTNISYDSPLSVENANIAILNAKNENCGYAELDAQNLKCIYVVDKKPIKTSLIKLENEEGCIRKFQKFFVGLNFQSILAERSDCNGCKN